MPSRKIRVRANKSSSKAASTKTLKLNGVDLLNPNQPTETNAPANPETMLATPEQLAALATEKSATVAPTNTPPSATSNDDSDTQADLSERAVARAAAAAAVAAFYNGASLPFKARDDLKRLSPINFNLAKNPSARSAALLATIITYCDVAADGTFVRGSGCVPGKLIGRTGKQANAQTFAGSESGGISNMLSSGNTLRQITYISGELGGPGCENAIFRVNFTEARNNMLAFNNTRDTGGKIFSAPLRLLRVIETRETKPVKPVKPVTDQPGDNVSDLPV